MNKGEIMAHCVYLFSFRSNIHAIEKLQRRKTQKFLHLTKSISKRALFFTLFLYIEILEQKTCSKISLF